MSIQAINKVSGEATGLPPDTMQALLLIADWADEGMQWFADIWTLSRKLGVDLPATNRIVSELVRRGYIRPSPSSRIYEVMPEGRKLRELPADNVGPLFQPARKETRE